MVLGGGVLEVVKILTFFEKFMNRSSSAILVFVLIYIHRSQIALSGTRYN